MALNIASSPLIGPVVALNIWTFCMEIWMYARRIPAFEKAIAAGKLQAKEGMTREDMNRLLPADVRWPADNFNHLFEQPTQFYAIASSLIFLGADDALTVKLAWGYVGVRIVHSLVQAIANKIVVRFGLFCFSSVILAAMTAKAALNVWR